MEGNAKTNSKVFINCQKGIKKILLRVTVQCIQVNNILMDPHVWSGPVVILYILEIATQS